MKKDKKQIKEMITKRNAIIQLLFLFLTLGLGIFLYNLKPEDVNGIILAVLVLISMENIYISIKDSNSQEKLDILLANIDKANGILFTHDEEGYFNLPEMIRNSSDDFFISGITVAGIWEHADEIKKILESGSKVNILLADNSAVEENAKVYFGFNKEMKEEEKSAYMDFIDNKMETTYVAVKSDKVLNKHFHNRNLLLRKSKAVFTTSFVGANVFSNTSSQKEIKVLFYQYKCGNTKKCPNIMLNPKENSHWYYYFCEQIEMQWKDAEEVIEL